MNGWVGGPEMEMFRTYNDRFMHRYMRGRMPRNFRERIPNQRNEEEKYIEEKDDKIYFEDLLTFPKRIYEKKEDIENDIELPSVQDFKKEKLNKLKEDIFYYCAPPEILNKLSKAIEDEKSYKINQDLNTKNFLFSQIIKNKILNDEKTKLKNIIKEKKLSNYIKELPKKLTSLENKEINQEEKDKEIENCSLITNKIDDMFFNYNNQKEEEILDDLKQLEKLILESKVSLKTLGYITYSLLEISLSNLLNSILHKYEKKESNNNLLKEFGNILISINNKVKSVKLLILLIQFCDSHKRISDSLNIQQNNLLQLISKDVINFEKLFKKDNIKNKIKLDYNIFWGKEEIKQQINNLYNTNFNDYLTLHYEDNLFVFLNYKNREPLNKEEQ